jgi:hypothetical protein
LPLPSALSTWLKLLRHGAIEQVMEIDDDSKIRTNKFKSDLGIFDTSTIVRKHIIFGDCYILDEEMYFGLKSKVANFFKIHPSEVLIVGSAKLGFSIARNKRYQPFGDQSDIDVAIISEVLFNNIWQLVFDFWEDMENTDSIVYWAKENHFKEFLFRGWIRPDKLPPASKFELSKRWWDFFRTLTNEGTYGPYKISAGLYKSWYYLEKYQSICVKECKLDLGLGVTL